MLFDRVLRASKQYKVSNAVQMANDSDLLGLLVLHARHRPDLWIFKHDIPYWLMDTYAIF